MAATRIVLLPVGIVLLFAAGVTETLMANLQDPRVAGQTYLLIARIPAEGLAAFAEYERSVLPLLAEHGVRLERRLRSSDGCFEAHLLQFPDAEVLTAYRDDPRRTALAPLLERSGAVTELVPVADVRD